MLEILTDSNVNLDEVDIKKTWDMALDILKKDIAPSTFEPWITPLVPACKKDVQYKNNIFVLKSHQAFGVSHLNQKFLPDIEEAIREALKKNVKVEIVFAPEDIKKVQKKKDKEQEIALREAQLENLKQMQSFSSLNLKYTFENFVEGENSRFAYQVAKMIAENPGQRKFNPLFISGSVGLGKTHLMQAIGYKILKNFPNLKVRYTKAEEFGNKLIEVLTTNKSSVDLNEKMKKFRDMHRNIDVLLIDDIQWIEGKKRTQDEIFNTFDALHQAGKQVVFASDRPLSAFELIPDRIKSRFEWGIEATITVPDLETRAKIVSRHAKASDYPISDEVALFLAQEFSTNVRELEGAYNKASTMAMLDNVDLTVENAKIYLNLDKRKKKITVNNIIENVAKYFSIDKEDILSTARAKEIVNARKYAIYLSREMLDLSYPALAIEFKKNHSTILFQFEKMKKEISTSKAMKIIVDEIKSLINKEAN